MQWVQLLLIVGGPLAALIIFAVRRGGAEMAPKVVGAAIGILAAFVVLVRTTDIVPDTAEDRVGDVFILVLAAMFASGSIALALYLSKRP